MKILFVNTHYFLPQSHGGLPNTLDQLCEGLQALGHSCVVLTAFRTGKSVFEWKTRAAIKLSKLGKDLAATCERSMDYPVWRAWNPEDVLSSIIKIEQPDAVVVMGGRVVPVVRAARPSKVPIIVQIHDVETKWLGGNLRDCRDLPFVANSRFTAGRLLEEHGIKAEIIYPFIPFDRYLVEPDGDCVTFINPLPRKGLSVAIGLAQHCSDIPFRFIGTIPEKAMTENNVREQIAQLSNLEVSPYTQDMQAVYRRCRILLIPSLWEEAYGRVISEAQASGIPALASTRGGIPEAVAKGGVLVSPDAPIEEWAYHLREIWNSTFIYDRLSKLAIESAARPELQKDYQLRMHEKIIAQAISA